MPYPGASGRHCKPGWHAPGSRGVALPRLLPDEPHQVLSGSGRGRGAKAIVCLPRPRSRSVHGTWIGRSRWCGRRSSSPWAGWPQSASIPRREVCRWRHWSGRCARRAGGTCLSPSATAASLRRLPLAERPGPPGTARGGTVPAEREGNFPHLPVLYPNLPTVDRPVSSALPCTCKKFPPRSSSCDRRCPSAMEREWTSRGDGTDRQIGAEARQGSPRRGRHTLLDRQAQPGADRSPDRALCPNRLAIAGRSRRGGDRRSPHPLPLGH